MARTTAGIEERITRLSGAARSSKELAEDDRAARDAAISEGDADGIGLRELSRLAKLSVSHVQRIVVQATAERQAARRDQQPGTD